MQCHVCGIQHVKRWTHNRAPYCAACFEQIDEVSDFHTAPIAQTQHLPYGVLQRTCQDMRDIDALFGELRSLHQNAYVASAKEWIWFLEKAQGLDPQKYKAQWLPYLEQMTLPPLTVGHLKDLFCATPRRLKKVLPRLLKLFPGQPSLRLVGDIDALNAIHKSDLSKFDTIIIHDADRLSNQAFNQPRFDALRTLVLTSEISIKPGDFDFHALTESNHMARLERLYLKGYHFNDDAMHALSTSRALPSLSTLRLSGTNVTARGINQLLQAENHQIDTLLIDRQQVRWSSECPVPTSYRLPLRRVEMQTVAEHDVAALDKLFGHLGDAFVR